MSDVVREGRFVAENALVRWHAQAFREWAAQNNLLKRGGTAIDPSIDRSRVRDTAFAMSSDATAVLERQMITAVGINEAKNTFYVYTTRRLTRENRKVLPLGIGDGVLIEYRQAKPISVNSELVDPFVTESPYSFVSKCYACGSSLGVGNARMAGTLGALVRDASGTLYGLTNNHVTGGCNNTRVGLPVMAPGILDVMVGGPDPFTIGHHHQVLPMRQGEPALVNHLDNTDAALFKVLDPTRVSSMQGSAYDTPTRVLDPLPDMVVEKLGRTSGHTRGRIESELIGPLPVAYKTVSYHSADDETLFAGVVYFEPVFMIRGEGGSFSRRGDSGSLVTTLTDAGRAAVGLIFSGLEPNESYMLPLRPILDRLGVSLVGGHNSA